MLEGMLSVGMKLTPTYVMSKSESSNIRDRARCKIDINWGQWKV
jgi:hypothetical protein